MLLANFAKSKAQYVAAHQERDKADRCKWYFIYVWNVNGDRVVQFMPKNTKSMPPKTAKNRAPQIGNEPYPEDSSNLLVFQ